MASDGRATTLTGNIGVAGATDAPAASPRLSKPVVCGTMAMLDAAIVFGCSYGAYLIWLLHDPYSRWSDYALVSLLGVLLGVNVFRAMGLYGFEALAHRRIPISRTLGGWSVTMFMLIAISYLTKTSGDYSRLWSVLWFGSTAVLLVTARALMRAQIRRWSAAGRLCRSVAVIGTVQAAQRVARHFGTRPDSEVRIVGLFSDRRADGSGIGDLASLVRLVRRDAVETVIVAIPPAEEGRLLRVLGRLRELPVDVLYCPGGLGAPFANLSPRSVDGLSVLTVFDRPLTDWRLIVKALEDRVLGALILALIAPAMAAIALLIKLETPGPVFFKQRRYGFNNQYIQVFKFRTMYDDQRDPNAEQLTRRNDPRITRLGAFLRKYSLDELPQFINVLRGEMSIVGPRPHALSAKAAGRLYQEAVRQYTARHRVKPGITGWAQVNGWRGETDTLEQIRKRVEHDLVYIDNWSLWFDMRIILLTLFKGFTGSNAF